MSNMLVEAFSAQLLRNMDPMQQAVGSMLTQQGKLGEINAIKVASDVGIEIDKARASSTNSQELNDFLAKQMAKLTQL